jgi:hypothetical protein
MSLNTRQSHWAETQASCEGENGCQVSEKQVEKHVNKSRTRAAPGLSMKSSRGFVRAPNTMTEKSTTTSVAAIKVAWCELSDWPADPCEDFQIDAQVTCFFSSVHYEEFLFPTPPRRSHRIHELYKLAVDCLIVTNKMIIATADGPASSRLRTAPTNPRRIRRTFRVEIVIDQCHRHSTAHQPCPPAVIYYYLSRPYDSFMACNQSMTEAQPEGNAGESVMPGIQV